MLSVLIVEDNKLFRELLREVLLNRFTPILVDEAEEAAEALRIVERSRPDIILMDIRLPGASGLELTRKIKARHPQVSIVIVTSHDIAEYREAASQYGADHFVHKGSFCRDKITAILQEAILKYQSGPDAGVGGDG